MLTAPAVAPVAPAADDPVDDAVVDALEPLDALVVVEAAVVGEAAVVAVAAAAVVVVVVLDESDDPHATISVAASAPMPNFMM
ncbi:MAG TPA: hypothetical protein VGC84_15130 [Ilumatobacteraceae bacterium]|jgi:hypothetical protein